MRQAISYALDRTPVGPERRRSGRARRRSPTSSPPGPTARRRTSTTTRTTRPRPSRCWPQAGYPTSDPDVLYRPQQSVTAAEGLPDRSRPSWPQVGITLKGLAVVGRRLLRQVPDARHGRQEQRVGPGRGRLGPGLVPDRREVVLPADPQRQRPAAQLEQLRVLQRPQAQHPHAARPWPPPATRPPTRCGTRPTWRPWARPPSIPLEDPNEPRSTVRRCTTASTSAAIQNCDLANVWLS